MAKKFVADISEVQGSTYIQPFQAPIKPPVDKTAAQLLTLGTDVYKDVQGNKLRQNLDTQAEDFIGEGEAARVVGATQQAHLLQEQSAELMQGDATPLTATESKLIFDAQKQANKLHKAFTQGRISSTAFRANTEKTLKEYINRTPGLSSEFRRIAQETLGFDPTGSRLKAAMGAADASNDSSKKQINNMGKLLEAAGLADKGNSREQNVEKYWPVYSSMKGKSFFATEGNKAMSAVHSMDKITHERLATDAAPMNQLNTVTEIKAILGGDITPSYVNSLSNEQKIELLSRVKNAKAVFSSSQIDNHGSISEKLDTINAGSLAMYDNAVDLLNGKIDSDVYNNSYNSKVNQAKSGIAETPQNAEMIAFMSMFPKGVALPPQVSIDFASWFQGAVAAGSAANSGISPNAAIENTNISDADKKVMKSHLLKNVKDAWIQSKDRMTPKNKEHLGRMIESYTDSVHKTGKVDMEVMDNMFGIAQDPEFSKYIKSIPNGSDVKQNLMLSGGHYLSQVFASIDAGMEGVNKSEQLLAIRDGQIAFIPSPSTPEANETFAKPFLEANRIKKIKNLNDTYAKRLNNIVRSTAHMNGHTDYSKTAKELLGKQLLTRIDTLVLDPKLAKELDIEINGKKEEEPLVIEMQ